MTATTLAVWASYERRNNAARREYVRGLCAHCGAVVRRKAGGRGRRGRVVLACDSCGHREVE